MRPADEHDAIEMRLECGSVVKLSTLDKPYKGYPYRCEGFDPDGVYASKLGLTHEQAIERWRESIKWERALHQRERYYTIEAQKNASRAQYFNGRRIK